MISMYHSCLSTPAVVHTPPFPQIHYQALQILNELSDAEQVKASIVKAGAIGFLLNLAHTTDDNQNGDITMIAKDILTKIGSHVAATVIQKVAKAFMVRRRVKVIHETFMAAVIMPELRMIKEQLRFPKIN